MTTKPKKPKPDNIVTLADLCKELKIDPREARVKLRAAKLASHKAGQPWEWAKGSAALTEAKKALSS